MDNEKLLQALSDMIDNKLEPIHQRLDQMDSRLKIMAVKQKRTAEQLAEVQLSQQYFELSTNKRLAKLQDEIDAIAVVLKIDELISI